MRLNLDRIQRTAESQPEEALYESGENSGLASFKRSNSRHAGYLFSCGGRGARRSKKFSSDERSRHLIACFVFW
jgi:hypothetical protein